MTRKPRPPMRMVWPSGSDAGKSVVATSAPSTPPAPPAGPRPARRTGPRRCRGRECGTGRTMVPLTLARLVAPAACGHVGAPLRGRRHQQGVTGHPLEELGVRAPDGRVASEPIGEFLATQLPRHHLREHEGVAAHGARADGQRVRPGHPPVPRSPAAWSPPPSPRRGQRATTAAHGLSQWRQPATRRCAGGQTYGGRTRELQTPGTGVSVHHHAGERATGTLPGFRASNGGNAST